MHFAPIFQDHAVLQRDLSLPIWGIGGPNEIVTVTFAGLLARTTSGPDGRWLIRFPALQAGGPYELVAESITGRAALKDILIGEVWLCSGQSNMGWTLNQSEPFDDEASAPMPNVRILTVANAAKLGQQEHIHGQWAVATSDALATFSAVGCWFGRKLHAELGVPIGLINNAWGGTRIQAWMSREALIQDADISNEVREYENQVFNPDSIPKDQFIGFGDWERRGAPQDGGNRGVTEGWAELKFNDSAWKTMPVPSRWQDEGVLENGILWFRHTVTVPTDWIGKKLQLSLGGIDKHDDTYVNGQWVGGLSWESGPNAWCTPRVYEVPGHLVGPDGRVCIAVRARSHVYHGGMHGPAKAMFLKVADGSAAQPIPLAGQWRYEIEQNWGVVAIPSMASIGGPDNPNSLYILFESRIAPLLPYGIRGVIWYQGESNAGEPAVYRRLMPAMIRDWRRAWGQGDFAFLQVQLANYQKAVASPSQSNWAELRDAQFSALSEPNTGMAVAIDVGEATDIHPKDKRSVGLRLAQWALTETYGRGGVPSGPLYVGKTEMAPGRVRIHLRHAEGLRTRDGGAIRHLSIAGKDRKFVWAQSAIEGESLVVWHPDISQPLSVRYAWADNPDTCNLINAAGLPASPFRTDAW